jgi:hypothetical protein
MLGEAHRQAELAFDPGRPLDAIRRRDGTEAEIVAEDEDPAGLSRLPQGLAQRCRGGAVDDDMKSGWRRVGLHE